MATELRLQYQGRGTFTASGASDLAACERLEPGHHYIAELVSPRSLSQNRMMWALMRHAFDNQRKGPEFEDVEHMRAWALIGAGHYTKQTFEPGTISRKACQTLRSSFLYADWRYNRRTHEVSLLTPAETRHMEMDKFSELLDRLAAFLVKEAVPGLEPGELIEAAKQSVKQQREAA
jgi:hypothetical protein